MSGAYVWCPHEDCIESDEWFESHAVMSTHHLTAHATPASENAAQRPQSLCVVDVLAQNVSDADLDAVGNPTNERMPSRDGYDALVNELVAITGAPMNIVEGVVARCVNIISAWVFLPPSTKRNAS